MPMTCPRCKTHVPDEVLYCPYCNLPKPKRGSAAAVSEAARPPDDSTHPSSFRATRAANPKVTGVPSKRPAKKERKLRFSVLAIAGLGAALIVGAYTLILPIARSQEAEPKKVLSALETLRHMPSNEPGLTIDARLTRELETSRRVGNLVAYQGWTVHRVSGTKTKVLLVYSFREVGDTERRAEWLADLVNNTFSAQTELAVLVSKK